MIQLTDKLAVKADNECYIVGEPRERLGKAVELVNPRYYPTLAQAVCGALSITLRQRVADDEITTLKDFLREAEKLRNDLTNKLEGLEV